MTIYDKYEHYCLFCDNYNPDKFRRIEQMSYNINDRKQYEKSNIQNDANAQPTNLNIGRSHSNIKICEKSLSKCSVTHPCDRRASYSNIRKHSHQRKISRPKTAYEEDNQPKNSFDVNHSYDYDFNSLTKTRLQAGHSPSKCTIKSDYAVHNSEGSNLVSSLKAPSSYGRRLESPNCVFSRPYYNDTNISKNSPNIEYTPRSSSREKMSRKSSYENYVSKHSFSKDTERKSSPTQAVFDEILTPTYDDRKISFSTRPSFDVESNNENRPSYKENTSSYNEAKLYDNNKRTYDGSKQSYYESKQIHEEFKTPYNELSYNENKQFYNDSRPSYESKPTYNESKQIHDECKTPYNENKQIFNGSKLHSNESKPSYKECKQSYNDSRQSNESKPSYKESKQSYNDSRPSNESKPSYNESKQSYNNSRSSYNESKVSYNQSKKSFNESAQSYLTGESKIPSYISEDKSYEDSKPSFESNAPAFKENKQQIRPTQNKEFYSEAKPLFAETPLLCFPNEDKTSYEIKVTNEGKQNIEKTELQEIKQELKKDDTPKSPTKQRKQTSFRDVTHSSCHHRKSCNCIICLDKLCTHMELTTTPEEAEIRRKIAEVCIQKKPCALHPGNDCSVTSCPEAIRITESCRNYHDGFAFSDIFQSNGSCGEQCTRYFLRFCVLCAFIKCFTLSWTAREVTTPDAM
ncbi:adhesive plaque matrix protein-like [Chrysoperla carnea]|uniref:adhesive plaque matrix protein-like n=1 Tax=Chrysoperla carnea TaxID=189513 RepID=UPI001D094258|nr:adhesive plaque matrix protein-like [Chrysoperla carnea]